MLREITQKNVHVLIPGKVAWIVECLNNDYGMNLHDALRRIYNTMMYKKLSDEATKYWQWSLVDLYKELLAEE